MEDVWNYYCIYPGSLERLDMTLEQLVVQSVAVCNHEPGWRGWFFMRYLDELGPHIRFRFKTTIAVSAHLRQRVEAVFEQALPIVAAAQVAPAGRLLPHHVEFPHTPATYLTADYEPEYGKYGGAIGVAIAERLFQCSSEVTVKVLAEQGHEVERVLFALLAMKAAMKLAMPKPKAQSAFLKRYLHFWTGEDRHGAAQLRTNLTVASSRRSAALHSQLEAQLQRPVAAGLLDLYRTALDEAYRQVAAEPSVHRSPEDLCFHFVHMMNNRLGIFPAEEAYLAALLDGSGDS